MKTIKRLCAFLAVLLLAGTAYARVDIHQDDDGTAEWLGTGTGPAGIGAHITVHLSDVSTATTHYAVVPFDAAIKRVRTALEGAITGGDAVITVAHSTSNPVVWTNIQGASGKVTIANSGSKAGITDDSGKITGSNTVSVGDVIAIGSDGGSTGAKAAIVIIELRVR